jgi:multidrug efflux pump subunit AcrA (membrane-fusion protein)
MANAVMAQSKDEHNAQVSQAQAKVNAAQEALVAAESAYQAAVSAKAEAEASSNSAKSNLDSVIQTQQAAQSSVNAAQTALQQAQSNYDTLLISDPSWIRPDVPEIYYVDVPYTVQISNTRQDTVTTQVARTVQVPHIETVTTTTQVARQITTVTQSGLTAQVYNMLGYNSAPPMPTDNRLICTINVPNINFQWGGGQVLCGYSEDVIVKFTGYIMAPTTGDYSFYTPADDGTRLYIDGQMIINDWYDKGGGGSVSSPMHLEANVPHEVTLYYYENGGGANVWMYWQTSGTGMNIVPASAFGETAQTTTVYDEVTTTTEVVTYTEETVYDEVTEVVDVVFYTEETRYRREERTRLIPDVNASAPLIKNSNLLQPIASAQAALASAQQILATATQNVSSAQAAYDSSLASVAEKSGIIEATSNDVNNRQQELNVAQQELEAIPPYVEPTPSPTQSEEPVEEPTTNEPEPLPEPESPTTPEESVSVINELETVAPENLTGAQVEQLVEAALVVFETAEQGSPEYEKALEALAVVAEADDPELPAELAAIPLLGDVAGAALEVLNNLGNIGADMSPKQREKAEETVVAAVVVGQVAQMAMGAATTAAVSAGAAPSGGSAGRRK